MKANPNLALLGAGGVIAAQIPTTIEKVADPVVKVLLQCLVLLIVIFAVMKIDLRKGFTPTIPPPPPSKT